MFVNLLNIFLWLGDSWVTVLSKNPKLLLYYARIEESLRKMLRTLTQLTQTLTQKYEFMFKTL